MLKSLVSRCFTFHGRLFFSKGENLFLDFPLVVSQDSRGLIPGPFIIHLQ